MILELLTVLAFLFTLAGYLRLFWWCTVVDFFRLHYAVFSLVIGAVALFDGSIGIVVVNAVLMAANLYRMRHFLPFNKANAGSSNKDIFSINAYKDNIAPDRLKKIILDADAELLLIMEMNEDFKVLLKTVLENYPHSLETPVRDGFSILLLSKVEMKDAHIHFCKAGDTPLLSAKINLKGRDYQVFSAHPKPAFNKKWKKERDAYFKEMKHFANHSDLPVIVLGDFNSVPWETHFIDFLKNTNLKSTLDGHGYKVTWPAFFPLIGVPMDHILISENIEYKDLHVGPFSGSDHFPISINLK